ncbi:hypothetical protein L208DRAFT_1213495, partial [Tricholoma matsutake]
FYQFTNSHPLYNTHHIKVGPDDDNIVVNFIGANLPHCDQGDRDYYCSTMLTLFKPWQTGKELKYSIENWNDAFSKHLFTARQLELMKNFNIQFECLDARDDYWAQLKKNASVLEEADFTFLEDCTSDNLYAHHSENDQDDIPLHLLQLGKREIKRQWEAMTMQNILTNLGW